MDRATVKCKAVYCKYIEVRSCLSARYINVKGFALYKATVFAKF